jgi:hypothetical protein
MPKAAVKGRRTDTRTMRGLLVAVVLVVAGCSGHAKTTTSSHAPPSSDPRALVLTTGDLARGYEYGDDTVCGDRTQAKAT